MKQGMKQGTMIERGVACALGALLMLVGCSEDGALGPRAPNANTPLQTKGTKTPLSVSPTALVFSAFALGSGNARTLVATLQFASELRATTSNAAVATVSPSSAITTETAPETHSAAFTVTPVGAGGCTITVIDKKGNQATVAVTVRLAGALYVLRTQDTIFAFAPGATGNVSPVDTIAGSNTGLNHPHGIAFDGSGRLYVANLSGPGITIYAAGASGNATPAATITGSNTGLNFPSDVAFDASGQIYVAEAGSPPAIRVFAPGASGNVAPIRTITGSNTGIVDPRGLMVDGSGNLYVADWGAPPTSSASVLVFAPVASGNATPNATIAGNKTELATPGGLALDASGRLYVADNTFNHVLIFAPAASGNVAPSDSIVTSNPLAGNGDVIFDASGQLYVANTGDHKILVFAAAASGNATPTATIAGSNTGLFNPLSVAFSP
jgi:hypothetical protein